MKPDSTNDEIQSETNKLATYFLYAGAVSGVSTFLQVSEKQ